VISKALTKKAGPWRPPVAKKRRRLMAGIDTEATGLDMFHGCKPFFVSACDELGSVSLWEWDIDPKTRVPIIPKEDLRTLQQYLFKENTNVN